MISFATNPDLQLCYIFRLTFVFQGMDCPLKVKRPSLEPRGTWNSAV